MFAQITALVIFIAMFIFIVEVRISYQVKSAGWELHFREIMHLQT